MLQINFYSLDDGEIMSVMERVSNINLMVVRREVFGRDLRSLTRLIKTKENMMKEMLRKYLIMGWARKKKSCLKKHLNLIIDINIMEH